MKLRVCILISLLSGVMIGWDNLAKAKGMAKYAENEPKIGKVQLIHMDKDITGKNRFHRLNLSKTGTRKKLRTVHTDDELNDLFETDGVFE